MVKVPKFQRVYHFLKTEHALNDITSRHIKLSRFSDANDPFELRTAVFENAKLEEFLLHKWSENVGMLCFCKDWSNPVMWAHYADRHRGMVLGLDLRYKEVKEVNYVSGRLPITVDESTMEELATKPNQKTIKKMQPYLLQKLTTKNVAWSYEKECRAVSPLEHRHENGNFYARFETTRGMYLRSVILGMACEEEEEDIRRMVIDYPAKVDIRRAILNANTFNMH